MSTSSQPSVHERWAQLRFAVVGPLLASPPPQGQLRAELERLAERTWKHPVSGQPVQFAVSTIERWLLAARNARHDPVRALRRKRRTDAGRQDSLNAAARRALVAQYQAHPGWSVQLHYDNLLSLAEGQPELRAVPSYWTVRRFLQAYGLRRRRRPGGARNTAGAQRAEARLAAREVRSYEAEYVGGLWHWDYHHGSRKVVSAQGEWVTPVLFGVLDDRSRLWPATCSGTWTRTPRTPPTLWRRRSRSAACCQCPRSGRWESRDLVSGNCRGRVAIAALQGLPTCGGRVRELAHRVGGSDG